MLKAKYQAHKLINVIFYIIVFLVGFYMGVMGQKIGIKDLFSKILMIDDVKALESEYFHCYTSDECFEIPTIDSNGAGNWNNEQYILKMFNYYVNKFNLDISFENYDNIVVYYTPQGSSTDFNYYFSNSTIEGTLSNFTITNYVNITYNVSTKNWLIFTSPNKGTISRNYYTYTASTNNNLNSNFLLTYDNYYTFNENLFANNNDFKQVCINPKNAFAISTTEIYQNNNNFGDYIWFPYNIIYLNYGRYNSQYSKMIFDEPTTDKHLFFNSDETFNNFTVNNGLQLVNGFNCTITSSYSYNNRYNYYGWSAYPFIFSNVNTDSPDISVYKFSTDFMTVQLSSFGIAHGGGIRRHYNLDDEENQNLQMCFYINKFYTVTELTLNSNGNYEGVIPTPNGDINLYSITGGDFFGNFHEEDFGLTAIITAPLNSIRQISNGTCTPQNINILGKNLTLPCGDTIFWGREDVQDFKIFWNMFFGGILCYGIGLSLYRKIHKFTNPLDDRVEVIDL